MKIAVCFAREGVDCEDAVRRMTEAMRLCDHHRCRVVPVAGGAIGCVLTSDQHSAIPLLRPTPDGNLLAISGVPIDLEGTLDERLDRVSRGGVGEAIAELKRLDGAFAALFWDARAGRLAVVTDALGIQPLYRARRDGRLILATELKAFTASGLVDVEMDPAAWGAFVSMGFNIGNETQLAGVTCVDPASTTVYDPAADRLESTRYWPWPEPRPDMKVEDVDTAEMLRIVRREVECYTSHCRPGTILLSGGFDSRLILAFLRQENVDCDALVLSRPGLRADAHFALRIARRLGCRNVQRVAASEDFFASPAYLRYLVMDEVTMPSMRLHLTHYLLAHIRPEMQAVWEGLGPGFVFAPAHEYPGGFAEYLRHRCRGVESMNWQAALSVFSASVGQAMVEGFRGLLERETGKHRDDEFGTARFQVEAQMRRFLAVAPMAVYANDVLPFTPGLSKPLWNLSAGLPVSVTGKKRLYVSLYKRHLPEAFEVPVCSGTKLYSQRAFAPGLWARARLTRLSQQWHFLWGRLPQMGVVGPALTRLGLVPRARMTRNAVLDAVVRRIDPSHPDLDADRVHALQNEAPPYDWMSRLSRGMLFYWQVWRWIMEGRLTTWNAETFLQEECS